MRTRGQLSLELLLLLSVYFAFILVFIQFTDSLIESSNGKTGDLLVQTHSRQRCWLSADFSARFSHARFLAPFMQGMPRDCTVNRSSFYWR
ncbi:hypothetical protein KJ765_00575 [Candidatus Micrarchaeota archaeon]|nr:hypothetical protein [Candidatus Micrarchaeota archaeon]